MKLLLGVLMTLAFCPATYCQTSSRPNILIADFEGDNYEAWKMTGTAFGTRPALGTLSGQMAVSGFRGKGLINSFHGGDASTGTLTSPVFKIERKYLAFLIGGGGWKDQTCMNLRIDGKIVRTTTGNNTESGGSENLHESGWDVQEFEGRQATIEIVDKHTGGWGHINVDDILQTDNKPTMPVALVPASHTLMVTHRYLHIPIKENAPMRSVKFVVDGKVVVTNNIHLADDISNNKPDWWAFLDVSVYKGKEITLSVDKLPENSQGLALIDQSNIIKDSENLYNEKLRPQLHFSSRRGWLNDPNGLVFYNNEYHLFYQHNPYSREWENMHWGHATSSDMLHWQEHGDVLAPDTLGPMFSGSAVVDWKNTSGFGKNGKPPLVLIYTAAGDPTTQCIAYSTDGRHFTKFAGNPVIPQVTGGNRDPKVFWHEPTKKWVLVLYVEKAGGNPKHTVQIFTSTNLTEWELASIVPGNDDRYLFECPDFFELPVDGDPKNKKWVLTAADSRYSIGSFDGTTFTPLTECTNLPDVQGNGFYAAQTYSDMPNNKRVQIGWIQAPSPGMSFNQCQSLPSELSLKTTAQGIRLVRTPIQALQKLRDGGDHSKNLDKFQAELIELRTELSQGDAESVEFDIRGIKIVYDALKQEIHVNNHKISAPFVNSKQNIIVYVDRTVTEVYASDGQVYLTLPHIPPAENKGVHVRPTGGKGKVGSVKVYKLKTVWN
jgi:fructan beta-fructosidase